MRNLWKHLRPYWWMIALMLGFTYGQTSANLALPDYMARIVNNGIVGHNETLIYQTGLTMLLVALLGGLCTVFISFLAARIAIGFTTHLRNDLFATIERFSLLEFNRFSTASLITRSTNDVQQVQMVLVMLLRMALMAPFMGIGAILKAHQLAPSMTWIMAVAIGTLMAVIVALFVVAMPKFSRMQKLVDSLNLVTREILTGLRVIRSFNKETDEERKFAERNRDLTDVSLFVNRLMAIMQPVMMLILNITSIAIVWIGAHAIDSGTLQIGDMLAFMQYAAQAIFAFLMISMIFILVPRAAVSVRRIAEVLNTKEAIRDPEHPQRLFNVGGEVEFRHVTFAYPGSEEPVLHDITFKALPGQMTAFIGSTGSGKTTLLNLIPRFYDVTDGEVLVDGVDVRKVAQADLRSRIGYVSQKAVLFAGTVASNIMYGSAKADQKVVERATDIAQAKEFVEQLENSYEHHIAQAGANVSGGQKQRLAIARAIARDPEMFLLDDSFSALDFATDARLRHALHEQAAGKTVLVVAQRVSSIMHADKIVVLDAGKVVGQGTHKELLKNCSVYREIASSQLSAEELGEAVVTVRPPSDKVAGAEI